ncbi:hypothetical protein A2W39_02005 [Candidatus Azambacteria bacterium RIFCSPHIGHO2_01_46_10]|uniref:Response regulatory domain-containing protein n=7 Tax=Candidatus Azamiibacteriota TaxID=1752741 RepID=A0A1F5BYS2_9BACT|nr:MAG: two-component system, sporulation family, response regulator, stage 0 sporulation protein A [Candidatus Azambacteria bacterium GW2011_GWC1_46_13]KKU34810.1 MAG: Response regulator DrrA [Candidatus Azambacteria bacterium GW2011_GWB1_46_27]KKU38025.1 MAG: Response regulator DrrA [Candidatus Azambacteria bacterium GW2011_GWF2_46_32]KKU39268.1 MAG: Response regulator DrrA [Candidatus Azambacteria bacterium GW2011_GWB2_46_37]KKU41773.1 MAG: Response regulator DrrA [Candidatus Azambacteria ba
MDQGKTILIVEDDRALSLTLKDNFEKEGFGIILAKDGVEGLKFALEQKPDLILLDIVMPNMDGMTMMRKLRDDVRGKKVPIILLTNLEADDAIMKGVIRDEPSYYLVKANWKMEDVIEKVKERLGS